MRNKYLNGLAILVLIITLGSCKKDELKQTDVILTGSNEFKSGGLNLVNGRLVFTDSTVFRSYVNWIKNNLSNPTVIKDYSTGLGFKSFIQIYDEGMKSTDSISFRNYISLHSNCFKSINVDGEAFQELPLGIISSYISNEQGLYQIGNYIIRETESAKLAITNGDETKLPKLFQNPNDVNDPFIIKIIYNTDYATAGSGQYSYRTSYFETKKRIVSRLYHSHEPIQNYPQYEARITSQRKAAFGIWVQEEITKLGQKNYAGSFYTYKNTNGGTPLLGPFSISIGVPIELNNASDIRQVIVMSNYHVEFTTSSCICEHWGYRGTVKREILNNELFPDNI